MTNEGKLIARLVDENKNVLNLENKISDLKTELHSKEIEITNMKSELKKIAKEKGRQLHFVVGRELIIVQEDNITYQEVSVVAQ